MFHPLITLLFGKIRKKNTNKNENKRMSSKPILNFISFDFSRAKGLKDEHGSEVHKFDHPWFQTGLMFIGKAVI